MRPGVAGSLHASSVYFDLKRVKMNERTIRDRAGDLWTVEDPWGAQERGTTTLRCRHELGYELLVTVETARRLDDSAVLDALERTRRRVPRAGLAEAA